MDSAQSKASELDRRASVRRSVRISVQGPDDDDYDVAGAAIADGFRPSEATIDSQSTSSTPSISSATIAQGSESSTSSTLSTPPQPSHARPSSISKPPRNHDSFSLRHDGAMGPLGGRDPARESSASTVSPYIPTDDPYAGPSAPSHPYQMYPQNVRTARTLSVTTTSTAPMPESPYNGERAPTHPYGMYPQGIDTVSNAVPAASIPVGFPGAQDTYHRRIGPEGEEIADMIGPDGHTEQLPPYTRYPDEAYARKVRDAELPVAGGVAGGVAAGVAAASQATAAAGPSSAAPAIPGAGGIGLATRNPEFDSTDEFDSPRSRHSSRSFASEHEINTAAAVVSEKQKPLKKWQVYARRRACGVIPYWAICLTIFILVSTAVLVGGVAGPLIAKQHQSLDRKPVPVSAGTTVTVTYDASPIPTPSNLPPLPTGTFNLPLGNTQSRSLCFDSAQTQFSLAWNCNVVMGMYINIAQGYVPPNGTGNYSVNIGCNQSLTLADGVLGYGTQPPIIPDPLPLELVNDTLEPQRGPAWFRMTRFNKTVILPEGFLPSPVSNTSTVAARDYNVFGVSPDAFKRKGVAQVGDKPWICTWPDTFLEVFVYPNQNSSWSFLGQGPPPSSASSSSSSSSSQSTTTSSSQYSSSTAYPGSVWPSHSPYRRTTDATPTSPTVSAPSSSASHDPDFAPIDGSGQPNYMPAYPKIVKVEERRTDKSSTPFCQQYEVVQDGQPPRPVHDDDGNPVIITLIDHEPASPSEDQKERMWRRDDGGHGHRSPKFARSTPELSNCGCMWYVT